MFAASSRSSLGSTLSSTHTQPTSTSAHKNTPQPGPQYLSIGDLTATINTVVGILTLILTTITLWIKIGNRRAQVNNRNGSIIVMAALGL